MSLLPFQANVSSVALGASIGFRPLLAIGVTTADGIVNAGIDASINVPSLSMEITQLSGVDENCNPLTGSSAVNELIGKFLGNVTNIVPSASVDLALGAHIGATIDGHGHVDSDSVTLLSTTTALPTMCLKFDEDSGTFAPATLPASVTATSSSGSHKKSSAADNLPTPRLAVVVVLAMLSGSVLMVWT